MTLRSTILANLITQLQTITTANSYGTNITSTSVSREFKSLNELGSTPMPWISVCPGPIRYDSYDSFSYVVADWEIDLICHVAGSSTSNRASLLDALENDIIRCTDANRNLTSSCIDCRVTSTETDEEDEYGHGTLKVSLLVRFARPTNANS
jgi:hypothetical protein